MSRTLEAPPRPRPPSHRKKPNYGFDRMKALVGAWQGTKKDGKTVKVTYALVADGSAVMETLEPGDESAARGPG